MAADWIKMRCELQTHPKVVRILSATNSDKFRVIGGLHAVWSIFDAHSTDGVLLGYKPEAMDAVIGWPGFSKAMIEVEWLSFNGQAIVMPEFSSHNGQSAKRRAEDQKRKRNGRKVPAQDADEIRTECGPEEIREEKKDKDLAPLTTEPAAPSGKPAAKRGSRLPEDWTLTDALAALGAKARKDAEMPELTAVEMRTEGEKFRDYWHSASGAKSMKLNWEGAWRNWCRNASSPKGAAGRSGFSSVAASARMAVTADDEAT